MSITEEQSPSEENNKNITTPITPVTVTEDTEQQQPTTTSSIQEYIKSLDQDYFNEIKENAKLKAFTVLFADNNKKIYTKERLQ